MANIEAGAFHRRNFTSSASEALTVDNTVGGKALTGATYGTSRYATISCEGSEMRFTVDGTPPTSTVGHVVNAPDVIELESNEEIVAFRIIRTGGNDGKIYATYKELKLTS